MTRTDAWLFIGSFIGYLATIAGAFALMMSRKIKTYQVKWTLGLPAILMLSAFIALEYPQSIRIAAVTALFACVLAFGLMLAAAVGERINNRASPGETDPLVRSVVSRITHRTLEERETLALKVRAGYQPPAPLNVSAGLLYADRAIIEVGDITNYEANALIRDCHRAVQAGARAITLQIHSTGGSVQDAWSMHDQVRVVSAMVNVAALVLGDCMSAATYILLAVPAHQRFATSRSTIMMHRHLMGNGDIPRDMMDTKIVKQLEREDERYIDMVVSSTGISRRSLEAVFEANKDMFLTAQQALELGIIGGVIDA